jgi:membrane protein DedA with SNARE-associated domain
MLGSFFHPSSYLGIFLFIASTGCGMPIPEEVAIVIAGVLSAQQHLHTPTAFAACLAGAIVGDSLMYAIGYHFGHGIFTAHPRFAKLFATENERQFQDAVEYHAFKVMLLARFLIGVRAPVYVMSGVVRMSFRRFLFYDVICATLVVSIVFTLAYVFGDHVAQWVRQTEVVATLVVLLILVAIIAVVYYRHRQQVFDFLFPTEVPPAKN